MRTAVSLLILTGLASACHAQSYSASGEITHNGTTLTLHSAAAIWDRAERRLSVALFPFELSREDVSQLQKSQPVFLAANKPSPDPTKWPSPPFAVLEIELTSGGATLRPENIRHYVLHAAWIYKKNATVSANRNPMGEVSNEFSKLAGRLSDGGSLQFSFRGSEKFPLGGDVLDWSLQVNTTVREKQ